MFVYGTLRRGSGSAAHDWLARRADCFGAASIQGRLYRIAHYPGLIASMDPAEQVRGEVYRLHDPETALRELDRYEECGPGFPEPAEYRRCQMVVTLADGRHCTAQVYLYIRPITDCARIVSGDFMEASSEVSKDDPFDPAEDVQAPESPWWL